MSCELNGSVDLLSSISTAECEPCRAGIDNIRNLVRGGGSIEGVPDEATADRFHQLRQGCGGANGAGGQGTDVSGK